MLIAALDDLNNNFLTKMVCDAGFYLDIISTFLLNMYELCSKTKVDVSKESKDKRRNEAQQRILRIRIGIGFTVNIVGFIIVCVLNRDSFISGATALGLFSTIIVYTVLFYSTITMILQILCTGGIISKQDQNSCMACYRIYEIVFDTFILFYSLVLSKWEMTEFTTATTVMACLDIFFNIFLCLKNLRDSGNIVCCY